AARQILCAGNESPALLLRWPHSHHSVTYRCMLLPDVSFAALLQRNIFRFRRFLLSGKQS
ncbi:hypothetical protein ACP3S9_24195, partial [Mixta calida]|uniref:hypothetical protein n=1 Tax=Mixta calida TaxID=665913 RepID=UPI003CE6AB53